MRRSRTLVSLAAASAAAATVQADPPFIPIDISLTATRVQEVGAADFNGDGDIDVLARSEIPGVVTLFENDGAEGFTPRVLLTTSDPNHRISTTIIVDLDVDGDPDLIASESNSPLRWHENDGQNIPTFTAHVLNGVPASTNSIFPVDADGDGDIDLFAKLGLYEIQFLENDGAQNFTSHVIYSSPEELEDVRFADIDSDGNIDAVRFWQGLIEWMKSDGADPPTLGSPREIFFTDEEVEVSPIYFDAVGVQDIGFGDFDGDGDLDVFSSTYADGGVRWHMQYNPLLPAFATQFISAERGTTIDSIRVVDVNGDARPDVVAMSKQDDTVRWFENDGEHVPSFTNHLIFDGVSNPRSVAVADVDSDADIDVLSASYNDEAVRWYANGACRFDLNADGAVGAGDLSILIGSWGMFGVPADAFLNGVGTDDLAELIGRWGPCP